MQLQDGYRFLVRFDQDGVAPLVMDEPAPLGEGRGPSASRVLAAAVGDCLSASALYCLRKARVPVLAMRTTVETRLARNAQGRLRIGSITVRIQAEVAPEDRARMGRCLDLFEEFCVVTQSVRQGIPVEVALEVPESR
jgi:uncharacterized OsmC-like protein